VQFPTRCRYNSKTVLRAQAARAHPHAPCALRVRSPPPQPHFPIRIQPPFGRRRNPVPLTNDADLSCIRATVRQGRDIAFALRWKMCITGELSRSRCPASLPAPRRLCGRSYPKFHPADISTAIALGTCARLAVVHVARCVGCAVLVLHLSPPWLILSDAMPALARAAVFTCRIRLCHR